MYTKQTWNTGDVITEEKLNHMEEGIATGGGIYSANEVYLFDGEVTTAKLNPGFPQSVIALQGALPNSDISVTFNGQNYMLPYADMPMGDYWGETDSEGTPVFTNFPVFIGDTGNGNVVAITAEAGTYSLRINEKAQKFEVSEELKNNVSYIVKVNEPEEGIFVMDKTVEELIGLMDKNVIIINDAAREYLISASDSGSVYTLGMSGGDPVLCHYTASDIEDYPSRNVES